MPDCFFVSNIKQAMHIVSPNMSRATQKADLEYLPSKYLFIDLGKNMEPTQITEHIWLGRLVSLSPELTGSAS